MSPEIPGEDLSTQVPGLDLTPASPGSTGGAKARSPRARAAQALVLGEEDPSPLNSRELHPSRGWARQSGLSLALFHVGVLDFVALPDDRPVAWRLLSARGRAADPLLSPSGARSPIGNSPALRTRAVPSPLEAWSYFPKLSHWGPTWRKRRHGGAKPDQKLRREPHLALSGDPGSASGTTWTRGQWRERETRAHPQLLPGVEGAPPRSCQTRSSSL